MISGVRKYRAPVLLLVTLVMVMLTGYLYSPWHKHDPLSRSTCPFAGYERGVQGEPTGAVIVVPPACSLLARAASEAILECTAARPLTGTRGPPSQSPLQAL
jgi:hypothetical protein